MEMFEVDDPSKKQFVKAGECVLICNVVKHKENFISQVLVCEVALNDAADG